jgi:tetratricopeptide (TPR) repeat protein
MSAEGKGDVEGAADLYQFVLDRVAPATDATGVAKMVIDLPLRIARLRTRASSSSAGPSYETARRYYEGWMGDPKAEEAIQSMAMERLAQVDADLGQWDRSLNTLRSLEDRLRRLPKPSKDPAEVRMTEYVVQTQAGSDPMIGRETLLSLLRDYPGWKSVPEALIILAGNASDRNEVDEALGYLDRIAEEHKTEEDALTKALLVRARILERHDRWPEALTACRSLQSEHPLSREALSVPLEIVNHYGRKNDTDGMQTALGKATQEYRDFLSQYPPGPLTRVARDHLIQALLLQRQFDLAINEMLTLSDELAGTADGQRMLYQAADLAGRALEDTTRVVAILDHAVELYPSTRFGSWASTEAGRLRETISQ